VLFVSFVTELVDDLNGPLTELDAPGEVTVELAAGDERTIYRQVGVPGAGAISASDEPDCEVTGPGGGRIEVGDAFDWTLTRDGDRYRALYDFDASASGGYRVSCGAARGASGRTPLVVGEQISLFGILGRMGAALAVFFGGGGIAVAIAIVTAVMRDGHKRRLQQQAIQGRAA
jgi:hypothetical protein